MKNVLTTILLLAGLVAGLPAQDAEATLKPLFFEAYVTSDLAKWQSGITQLEAAVNLHPDDDRRRDARALAQYGAVSACFATGEERTARRLLGQAEQHVKKLLRRDDEVAAYHALIAGIYGMQIALSPMKGMFLGPKNNRHVDRALALDPQCSDGHYQRGASLLNTPAMWGGDVGEAAVALEKACRLYEGEGVVRDWRYLNALAMLGQAYQESGRPEAARDTYHKALAIAPEFGWVKEVLLPEIADR